MTDESIFFVVRRTDFIIIIIVDIYHPIVVAVVVVVVKGTTTGVMMMMISTSFRNKKRQRFAGVSTPPGNPSIVRLPRRGAEVVGEGGWIGDDGRKDDSRGGGSFSRPIPTRYGNLWMSRWPVSQDGRDRDDVP